MSPKIVSIEGNIGAGKSTLLEHIRRKASEKSTNIVFMQEPVDLWETIKDSVSGETILSKFYKDPATYSFPFQVMAYTSRLAAFQRIVAEHPDCQVIVCERSLEADRNIFAKMLSDDGMIDEVMYRVYMMLYDNTSHSFPIDTVIYLDADAEICLGRVGKRAREGESKISVEYLRKCQQYYDNWMMNLESAGKNVVRLNANIDTEYEPGDQGHKWVEQILNCLF